MDKQNQLVVVTDPSNIATLSDRAISAGRWLYLGKDVKTNCHVKSVLGARKQWRLREKLHQVANNLRKPFLNFVAEVGRHQHNQITWWSTSFSWKVAGASDLFLLVSYLFLAQEVIQEALASRTRLIIVVEDPWLLRQMKENFSVHKDVHFVQNGILWRQKAEAVLLCVVKRAWWLLRMLWRYWQQRRVWPADKKKVPTKPTIALYTYPLRQCLRGNGGWEDPFLPRLDHFLHDLGYELIRLSPPECSGFECELAKRHTYFQPMILLLTLNGICRSVLAFWWPKWPSQVSIEGMSVKRLAEREWWMEVARSSLCVYRMFYECLEKIVDQGEWRWIIYPYENQPWEKMIALCSQERGIRTAGIQHSTLSIFYMSYFLGAGEAHHMPLPDVILTSGAFPHKLLVEGGNPVEKLKMAGSIRYNHLTDTTQKASSPVLEPAPRSEILVALPIDIHMARHLLAAIGSSFPSGGREEGLRFHIKAHPMCPICVEEIGFPAIEASSNLYEALRSCGLVIFGGSTLGPEALAMGRPILRYRSQLLLDVDPSEAYSDSISTCTDENLREAVIVHVHNTRGTAPSEHNRAATDQIFAALSRGMLREIFHI